jgi:hypothetical protein
MSVAIGSILRAFYNGAVAVGATCTVYQSGTTTKVTLYSDAALTTPITNPQTSDANGEFSFYVASANNLRVYLQTSGGTLIKDIDPFYPAPVNIKGANIASATTTDIASATGDFIDITGTTTITGLGNAVAGAERVVRFNGALTLTYNASSLILPGGASITTASGDTAIFRSLGSSNWVCTAYIKASGDSISKRKGSDIASATTTDLSAATGDFIDITGTTAITGLGTATAGVERTVRFNGALTLTYNATSLILPGGASITTASGDTAVFRSLGSGNWVCISYVKANGAVVVGLVSVTDTRTNTVNYASTIRATTTGTPANGIGVGQLFQSQSADENPSDTGQIDFVYDDVTAGSEDTRLRVWLRRAGAALAVAYEWVVTTAFKYIFTGAPSANRTITLPDVDLNLAALCIDVYRSGGQSITNGSFTKIQFNAENFDIGNTFDSTTNNRWVPGVVGKYGVYAQARVNATTNTGVYIEIAVYKNGVEVKRGSQLVYTNTSNNPHAQVFAIVDITSITDYIEVFFKHNDASADTLTGNSNDSYMNGYKLNY